MTCFVTVELICFGEPEMGIWCDDCLLPSKVRQPMIGQMGMSTMALPDLEFCLHHDHRSESEIAGEYRNGLDL